MTDRELMQQALEALEANLGNWAAKTKAIAALRERLTIIKNYPEKDNSAQPEPEPVAYAVYHRMGGGKSLHWPEQHSPDGDANEYQLAPLYTAPPHPKPEPVAWRDAAIRLGEELSSVGPDGYYNMTAQQWLDWAMEQQPVGKTALAQPDMPLFDDWPQFACPPCNHDCDQGRKCPHK